MLRIYSSYIILARNFYFSSVNNFQKSKVQELYFQISIYHQNYIWQIYHLDFIFLFKSNNIIFKKYFINFNKIKYKYNFLNIEIR